MLQAIELKLTRRDTSIRSIPCRRFPLGVHCSRS